MLIENAVTSVLLSFCRHFPLEFGKWRLSSWLQRRTTNIRATVRTSYGFLMHLDTNDFIQHNIFVTGRWDDDVGHIVRTTLKADDVFVDIGANVGYFSIMAARHCRQVISFEPNPVCLKQLTANVRLNRLRNIDVRPIGLANERRMAEFNVEVESNVGGGTLRQGAGKGFMAQLDKLDDQLSDISIRLIKIDVEGAEMLALLGAAKILANDDAPDVICEVSQYSLKQLGSSEEQLFSLMDAHGYKYRIISPIRKSNLSDLVPTFQYDVLFYRARRLPDKFSH